MVDENGIYRGNLSIEGDVHLEHSNVSSIPDGLSVEGNLSLAWCRGITTLPDGLSVGGNLETQSTSENNFFN